MLRDSLLEENFELEDEKNGLSDSSDSSVNSITDYKFEWERKNSKKRDDSNRSSVRFGKRYQMLSPNRNNSLPLSIKRDSSFDKASEFRKNLQSMNSSLVSNSDDKSRNAKNEKIKDKLQ